MRCIRSQINQPENAVTVPCERCTRNQRFCKIPEPRPLGRKRGATGRFQGVDKAFRKLQSELKRAKTSHLSETSDELAIDLVARGYPVMEPLISSQIVEEPQQACGVDNGKTLLPCMSSDGSHKEDPGRIILSSPFHSGEVPQFNQEPTSNPLALLADASDAAQALELHPESTNTLETMNGKSCVAEPSVSLTNGLSISDQLLHQPGCVSIGLQHFDKNALKAGINTLVLPFGKPSRYLNYFKKSAPLRDVGSDVDPVDLGLVTMQEAYHLFPVYG